MSLNRIFRPGFEAGAAGLKRSAAPSQQIEKRGYYSGPGEGVDVYGIDTVRSIFYTPYAPWF